MKVLVVEDEIQIASSIKRYLTDETMVCEVTSNMRESRMRLSSNIYDLIVLDITLPDGDGLTLVEHIRLHQTEKTGVLILSARDSLDDKLNGLQLGADDYLTKPFHLAELNARLLAIARRKNFDRKNCITFNEISINIHSKEVTIHGLVLSLTRKEYLLLLYFVNNKNRVLTKQGIAEHLWDDHIDYLENIDFVYTHIKNLRRKIAEANGQDYVKSVYGMGYRFSVS